MLNCCGRNWNQVYIQFSLKELSVMARYPLITYVYLSRTIQSFLNTNFFPKFIVKYFIFYPIFIVYLLPNIISNTEINQGKNITEKHSSLIFAICNFCKYSLLLLANLIQNYVFSILNDFYFNQKAFWQRIFFIPKMSIF